MFSWQEPGRDIGRDFSRRQGPTGQDWPADHGQRLFFRTRAQSRPRFRTQNNDEPDSGFADHVAAPSIGALKIVGEVSCATTATRGHPSANSQDRHPFLGCLQLRDTLRLEGLRMERKWVLRLMSTSIYRRKTPASSTPSAQRARIWLSSWTGTHDASSPSVYRTARRQNSALKRSKTPSPATAHMRFSVPTKVADFPVHPAPKMLRHIASPSG